MKNVLTMLCLLLSAANSSFAQPGAISLNRPTSLAVDSQNNIYVAEESQIFKRTPAGEWSIFLNNDTKNRDTGQRIYKMVIDAQDNIYSIDRRGANIIKISPRGQVISYAGNARQSGFADAQGAAARFESLEKIAIDDQGVLYVIDRALKHAQGFNDYKRNFEYSVRAIGPDLQVTTIMKNDNTTPYWLPYPVDLAVAADGGILFRSYYSIVKLSEKDGRIKTEIFAGNREPAIASNKGHYYQKFILGDVKKAEFQDASHLVFSPEGDLVFLNLYTLTVLKVSSAKINLLAGGNDYSCYLQVICGSAEKGYRDGKASTALFAQIDALVFDNEGNLLILDTGNKAIRKLSKDGMVSTLFQSAK